MGGKIFPFIGLMITHTYYHLHSLSNVSALSHLMDKGYKWVATIIDWVGFYHHQLLLSKTILDNAMLFHYLYLRVGIYSGLQPSITSSFCVEVTDVTTNTISYFKSAASAVKHIGCDIGSISVNWTQPLKNKYLFNYIDVVELEYVKHTPSIWK